jgi:hypothetical protein
VLGGHGTSADASTRFYRCTNQSEMWILTTTLTGIGPSPWTSRTRGLLAWSHVDLLIWLFTCACSCMRPFISLVYRENIGNGVKAKMGYE